jgi:hypothetical protein
MNAHMQVKERAPARPAHSRPAPLSRGSRVGLLQRKCSCGGTAGADGECEECRKKRSGSQDPSGLQAKLALGHDFSHVAVRPQPRLAIGPPGDRFEQEADRAAEAVVGGTSLPGGVGPRAASPGVQRDDGEKKPPSDADKYKEGATAVGEAFLETDVGKRLKDQATRLGKEFLATLPGKIIAGSAAVGTVAAIAATNSALPMQVPEIPLDALTPGMSMKLTYEGPVRKPTAASITFTYTLGAGGGREKKPAMSESEKYRAETARMAADLAKFREGLKTPEERATDTAMWDAYWRMKATDPLNPLGIPGLKPKKEDETLRRKEAGTAPAAQKAPIAAEAPPAVDEALAESGQPLDSSTREFMETRFGHDFSRVRVHADARAAESARAVGARAYTVGADIVFGRGEYTPHTTAGRMLLAHELTHVVQQGGGSGQQVSPSVLQRAVVYVNQLTGTAAAPFLKQFDDTVAGMIPQAANVPGPEGDDFRDALARLQAMRAAGKVTFWQVQVTGLVFASYDNATDELRIHTNIGNLQDSPVGLMHEAIHAVHAERYPRLRQLYAQVLQAGGTKNQGLGVLLLKWKVWTEYWAYGRQAEFGNVIGGACQVNVHRSAMLQDDVRTSIRAVVAVTGATFDPSTWSPPAQYLAPAKPGQKQTPGPSTRISTTGRTGTSGQQETLTVDKASPMVEFAEKAGYDPRCILRFNPEMSVISQLSAGDELWLLQRKVVPAGVHTNLSDFCREYLGNEYAWPTVWAANPEIKGPVLKPTDKIKVPLDLLTLPVATLA